MFRRRLVGFPIALFLATIALELAHVATRDPFFYRSAMIANLAGLAMVLLVVLSGALDLGSRTRAATHAALDLVTVALFALSGVLLLYGWIDRVLIDGTYTLSVHVPLAVGMLGMVAMVSGTLLERALVHIQQLGVEAATTRDRVPHAVTARHAIIM